MLAVVAFDVDLRHDSGIVRSRTDLRWDFGRQCDCNPKTTGRPYSTAACS